MFIFRIPTIWLFIDDFAGGVDIFINGNSCFTLCHLMGAGNSLTVTTFIIASFGFFRNYDFAA